MPPVFDQGGSSACVQVAEIWYSFAYEVNRLRNIYSGDNVGDTNYWHNQYHPFYTYNFLNDGNGQSDTEYKSGFRIIKENGCPPYKYYDDPALQSSNDDKYKYWMNEFDNYKQGMYNKISGYENITWDSSYASIDLLKHWVADHNLGDSTGGLAIISVFTNGWKTYNAFLPCTPEEYQHYVSQWGTSGGHALTIVGYHDSVQCFNLNNDGQYSNVDNDGDGVIELSECELGAFKVVNSWGEGWKDNGYIYVPYEMFAEGLQVNKRAYVCHAIEDNTPELLVKSNVEYPAREEIAYSVGYAENADSVSPTLSSGYKNFAFQGGANEMRGVYTGPLESALDFGYKYGENDIGKIFFRINERDMNHQYSGTMESFSIMDYRWDEVFELECTQQNISITDPGLHTFFIDYDLIVPGDNQMIVSDDTLFSNMVSRFEPTVDNNSTLLIKQGVNVDFYNSNLIIKEGSTLIIEDSEMV